MPIGLGNIGWKMYMINASWDVVILGLIVGLTMKFLRNMLTSLGLLFCGNERQNAGGDRRGV